jgi:hypothetical protein
MGTVCKWIPKSLLPDRMLTAKDMMAEKIADDIRNTPKPCES